MSFPFVFRTCVLCVLAVVCAPALVAAQAVEEPEEPYNAPPHLSLVDGDAELVREGRIDTAQEGQILATGDRLQTTRGRVEVLFGDGSALHLDHDSVLDVLDAGLLRLVSGRLLLYIAHAGGSSSYRIDTPSGSVYANEPGEYRVEVDDEAGAVTDVAVARGRATVTHLGSAVTLRPGQRVRVAVDRRPGVVTAFNAAYSDAFGRWSRARMYEDVDRHASYLPPALARYGRTLGRHGHWAHHPTHGHVWYPRAAHGWRPFFHGSWSVLSPFGWTWVGLDPWVWPTHYYGFWGVTAAGAWFWVPGPVWRPAPVHWTVTATHIGWVPWGFHGVEVFGFTVIPRSVFTVNVFVPRHVVRVHSLRPVVRTVFVSNPPLSPHGVAAPRAFSAASRPVRTAVPRVAATGAEIHAADGRRARLRGSAAAPGVEPPRSRLDAARSGPAVDTRRARTADAGTDRFSFRDRGVAVGRIPAGVPDDSGRRPLATVQDATSLRRSRTAAGRSSPLEDRGAVLSAAGRFSYRPRGPEARTLPSSPGLAREATPASRGVGTIVSPGRMERPSGFSRGPQARWGVERGSPQLSPSAGAAERQAMPRGAAVPGQAGGNGGGVRQRWPGGR